MRGAATATSDYEMETSYPSFSYGWAPLRGLVSGPMKYIEAPRPELYELPKDPRELHDLAAVSAARRDELARALVARAGTPAAAVPADDPDDEERARSSPPSATPRSAAPERGAIDPKDGISPARAGGRAPRCSWGIRRTRCSAESPARRQSDERPGFSWDRRSSRPARSPSRSRPTKRWRRRRRTMRWPGSISATPMRLSAPRTTQLGLGQGRA